MPRYPDIANPDLLDRVPLSARSVLDVGCSTGALGLEYRRRNPRARLIGVDADRGAVAVAATRLDRAFLADLDSELVPFQQEIPAGGFDCIVYGDVLEHLRDPWSVLAAHLKTLAHDGVVLICMPNLGHWSFIERLLRGTWSYEASGLLDRSHLRWFTTATMRQTIAEVGLHPVDVVPRCFEPAKAAAFVEAITPALTLLGIDAAGYAQNAAPLQHVWRAQRQPAPAMLVAFTRLDPVGGVSDVRVTEPCRALIGEPSILPQLVELSGLPPPDDRPRILVLHRPLLAGEAGLDLVRGLVRAGWLIVCEFDDHPDYIPVLQRPDIQNFRAVHAIQTSTKSLARVLGAQNPEVAIFPNAIARLPEPRNHLDPACQTLFFGGLNRELDWPALLPGLNGAAARAGARLRFRIVADRSLFDALDTPYKEYYPLCDYETYKSILAGCEMSFMPLADTPFNRCKSDLKFLEAAAHRVTALASHVVYADTLRDGQTGLLFRDSLELQQRILRLVTNPELGRTLANAARSYVAAERMLAYQVSQRATWYHSLWRRRDALHQALIERVPEMLAVPSQA